MIIPGELTDLTVFGRLLLAALLGGLVGVEREMHGRPAGFRTHLLVTVGACLMVIVSEGFYAKYGLLSGSGVVRLDPARVAAQIVTGIGFLGAGAIIKDGASVRGLTTAACLWLAAGIGMAVGIGLYPAALFVTALSLFSLLFLKRAERYLRAENYHRIILHCVAGGGDVLPQIEQSLAAQGIRVVNFGFETDLATGVVIYSFVVTRSGHEDRSTLVQGLVALPEVTKVRYS